MDRLLHNELKGVVGADRISTEQAILVSYAFDSSPIPPSWPGCVVMPVNTAEVQKIMEIANRNKVPVTPVSAGVNVAGTGIPEQGGIILDLRWMDKILEINDDACYALVEPGVTFDQLTSSLHAAGFRCHVPTAPGGASVVANYFSRPSGSLSARHIDAITSLEVVLPDGTLVRTGSAAFPTGGWNIRYGPFPDLTGLFCCAYGTMGVITKAAIRIYPVEEEQGIPLVAFKEFHKSVEFVKEAVRANLVEHCIIWNYHFYKTYDIEFKNQNNLIIPAELHQDPRHAPDHLPYNLVSCNISGHQEDVNNHVKLISTLAEKHGGQAMSLQDCREHLPGVERSFAQFYLEHRQPKMEHNKKYGLGRYIPWIVQGEPSIIAELEKEAVDRLYSLGTTPICYYSQPFDWGRSFFFRMFTFINPQDKELTGKVVSTYREMYQWALEKYGATPFRHRRDPYFTSILGGYYDLLKTVKKVIDPNNIMNPGVSLF